MNCDVCGAYAKGKHGFSGYGFHVAFCDEHCPGSVDGTLCSTPGCKGAHRLAEKYPDAFPGQSPVPAITTRRAALEDAVENGGVVIGPLADSGPLVVDRSGERTVFVVKQFFVPDHTEIVGAYSTRAHAEAIAGLLGVSTEYDIVEMVVDREGGAVAQAKVARQAEEDRKLREQRIAEIEAKVREVAERCLAEQYDPDESGTITVELRIVDNPPKP